MTKHRNYSWSVLIAAGLLAACSSAGGTTDGSATAAPAQAPTNGAAGAAAAPTGTPAANAATPAAGVKTDTAASNAPAMAMAAAPVNTAAPNAGAPGAPAAGEAMAPVAGPANTCTDRTVSYAKPCHNDPDPCGLKSGWPGDEYCLLPPKEGEGVQIHFGPKDFKDMSEVMKYAIQSGEEFDNSVAAHIPLTEEKFFQRMTVQMRPGSHHWISSVANGKIDEKFYDDTGCGGSTGAGSLGGGQNLIYDNPPGGIPAPENAGLGRSVVGNSSLCMNLHSYNFTDRVQMREIWINLYFIDEDKVTQRAAPIAMVGGLGLSLGPRQNKEATYMGTFGGDGRIIQMYGHRHAWTPRFAVWLRDELIYDSHSWQDSVTFNYDSISKNPPIMTANKIDGAVSGIVEFKAGDPLKFTCFIENDSDNTLRFSNQVYDGEMCNLWGSTVGTGISGTFL
jgi:hypothetical protein